jgi:caa(3)-type oxidase subunit IV
MNLEQPSRKLFVIVWLTLVAMHFTILGSAYLNLGFIKTPIIIVLAIIQMILIILYFMEVRYSAKLICLFATAGFCILLIQWTLTMSDFLTRQWH